MADISTLKGWNKNPRGIKKDDFERLKSQIKELGLYKPFLVERTEKIVLGGNMRLKACLELGIKDVPVSYVDAPTDELKIKYALSDNDRAGYYEEDQLAELVLSVPELDLSNYKVDLGKLTSIDDLLSQFAPEPEEDEAPEVSSEPPVSKLGEIYQLGRHRLMCGDSTKIEDVEKLMDGKKADMVFTDPPYGVDYTGGIQFTKDGVKTNQRERLIADDKETDIYSEVVPLLVSFCDGPIYTWFSDTQVVPVYQAVNKVGDIHALIIWVKNGGYSSMNANYKQKHEPCLYWKGKGKKLNFVGPTTETTIWNIDKDGVNKLHPTQKPVALAHKAIMNHSAGLVMDLFLGSGSTLIACEQTNRTCYGMELDPKYVDVIRKRYAKFIDPDNWETKWEEMTCQK